MLFHLLKGTSFCMVLQEALVLQQLRPLLLLPVKRLQLPLLAMQLLHQQLQQVCLA